MIGEHIPNWVIYNLLSSWLLNSSVDFAAFDAGQIKWVTLTHGDWLSSGGRHILLQWLDILEISSNLSLLIREVFRDPQGSGAMWTANMFLDTHSNPGILRSWIVNKICWLSYCPFGNLGLLFNIQYYWSSGIPWISIAIDYSFNPGHWSWVTTCVHFFLIASFQSLLLISSVLLFRICTLGLDYLNLQSLIQSRLFLLTREIVETGSEPASWYGRRRTQHQDTEARQYRERCNEERATVWIEDKTSIWLDDSSWIIGLGTKKVVTVSPSTTRCLRLDGSK